MREKGRGRESRGREGRGKKKEGERGKRDGSERKERERERRRWRQDKRERDYGTMSPVTSGLPRRPHLPSVPLSPAGHLFAGVAFNQLNPLEPP